MTHATTSVVLLSLLLLITAACQPKSESPSQHTDHHDHSVHDDHDHAGDMGATTRTPKHNNSLYVIDEPWLNQNGQKATLADNQGRAVLVAMIFTQCGHACPMMVSNMQEIEADLPPKLKDEVQYILVTFDTEHDTPEVLARYAEHHTLNDKWTLLHGSDDQVRTLSMLLNIQYNQLDNGQFNHSNILTLLDKNGTMVKQYEGLGGQADRIIQDIRQTLSH